MLLLNFLVTLCPLSLHSLLIFPLLFASLLSHFLISSLFILSLSVSILFLTPSFYLFSLSLTFPFPIPPPPSIPLIIPPLLSSPPSIPLIIPPLSSPPPFSQTAFKLTQSDSLSTMCCITRATRRPSLGYTDPTGFLTSTSLRFIRKHLQAYRLVKVLLGERVVRGVIVVLYILCINTVLQYYITINRK